MTKQKTKKKTKKQTHYSLKREDDRLFVKEDNLQPKLFEEEITTVWSFPDRGDWATHKGNFPGN